MYLVNDKVVKVEPKEKVVLFLADTIVHQVEPITSPNYERVTLTVWMKTKIEHYLLCKCDREIYIDIIRKHFPSTLKYLV